MSSVTNDRQSIEARNFLQQTRKNKTVGYQILPELEHCSMETKTPFELSNQYGQAYRKYLHHSLISEKIRNACRIAVKSMKDLSYPHTGFTWASYHMGPDLMEILNGLTKGVIIDPYLNESFPVGEFKGSALAKYLKDGSIVVYVNSIAVPPVENREEAQQIAIQISNESQRIVAVAKKILNSERNANKTIISLNFIIQALTSEKSKK